MSSTMMAPEVGASMVSCFLMRTLYWITTGLAGWAWQTKVCTLYLLCVCLVILQFSGRLFIVYDMKTWLRNTNNRVRTILVFGYWVLGNIHRYWIVLLLGDIFCSSDTQYNLPIRQQSALCTIHIPVNESLVPLLTCTLTDAIVCPDTVLISYCLLNTIIVIIIEFWDFSGSLIAML